MPSPALLYQLYKDEFDGAYSMSPSSDEGSKVVASTTRLYDEVGHAPRYDLETGLRDTIEWWRGL